MDLEEARPPYIRDAFLALDAFWFLFSFGYLFFAVVYVQGIREGDIFCFTRLLSFFIAGFSTLSLIILIYALFLKKGVRKVSFREKIKDPKYRYLIFLLPLFLIGIFTYFLERDYRFYEAMLSSALLTLVLSLTVPILVFFLSFKSSGKDTIKTMKEYLSTTFFFSLVIIFAISSLAVILPFLSPDVSFYMRYDPSETYWYEGENGTMGQLVIVNKGILPAKDIIVMDNGTEVRHIRVLRGGTYQYVDVRIHCRLNRSHENSTYWNDTSYDYGYGNESPPCDVNISLVYGGDVVDRITQLQPYQSTCEDIFLIMGAPAILLTKKMRKKRE